MSKSHFMVRTYFEDCPCIDNSQAYCLQRELETETAVEAIFHAKCLKALHEITRIVVVESAIGYADRILYEFERSN